MIIHNMANTKERIISVTYHVIM